MNNKPVRFIHELVDTQCLTRPDHIALIDSQGHSLSWKAYAQCIVQAASLLSEHGIRRGDRVLLIAENCINVAVFVFACSKLGAIVVPVNARMTAPEIARIKNHASPALTVYTTSVSDSANQHADVVSAKVVNLDGGRIRIEKATHSDKLSLDELGDAAVLLYTTGTTGAPKGVMLSHGNLLFAGEVSSSFRGMQQQDRLYGVLPLTHVFGVASMLMAGTTVGATIELETRFSPERLHTALMNGVTILPAVPQLHALLMQYATEQGIQRLQSSTLRYVSSGAAPLDPGWKRKAESFYGVALQNGYGMTETTAGICVTQNEIGSLDTSVGLPLPGVQIRIDAGKGNDNAKGEGEIQTRGPHVMLGYFRDPDATDAALDDEGYLRTGDIGRIDDQGRLHVLGRCKELIIRGGFNVFPPEVETALNDHPSVVMCAVVGRATDTGDEEILAFVQRAANASIDETELKAYAAQRLAAYKCPTYILFVEALPAAATGKILKHTLLDVFEVQLSKLTGASPA